MPAMFTKLKLPKRKLYMHAPQMIILYWIFATQYAVKARALNVPYMDFVHIDCGLFYNRV